MLTIANALRYGSAVAGVRQPDVIVSREGTTGVVRLNRPRKGNAIGGALFRLLLEAVEDLDADDGARAIVTTGAGHAYCVGADRDALLRLSARCPLNLSAAGPEALGGELGVARSPVQSRAEHLGLGRWAARFLDVGTPTIAAINGGAAGGGLALAVLHDWRVAARTARLAPGFAALGVAPELGASWLLPRLVGARTAFALLTRSESLAADEALEAGLVDAVVEDDELLDAALAKAQELGSLPAVAYRATKRLLREAGGASLGDQLEREWAAQLQLFADPQTADTLRSALTAASQNANDRLR